MASRSLGTLTLDLVANLGGYTAGMDKAEKEAQKRARAIEKAFDTTFAGIGAAIATMTAAGTAALAIVNQQAEAIANYQDLAEKIGDTAEAVASLQVAATVSETSLDSVAAASVRLTTALSKTDDESKLVGQALSAIGLEFESFKDLSPVDQVEAVANAFANFEDGAEKTAVAVALFGKAGAELIPFLNDLADGSERQLILTQEQIDQADEYTKTQARLKGEFDIFIKQQSAALLPVLKEVSQIFIDLAKDQDTVRLATDALQVTVKTAIVAFQTLAVIGLEVRTMYQLLAKDIENANKQREAAAQGLGDFSLFKKMAAESKDDGKKIREEADAVIDRIMAVGKAREGLDVSAFNIDQYLPKESGNKIDTKGLATGSGGKAKVDELAKYIDGLQKEIQKTSELTRVEQILADVQSGRLGKVSATQQQILIGLGEQVDAAKQNAEAWSFVASSQESATKAAQDALLANQALAESYRNALDPAREIHAEMQRIDDLVSEGFLTPDEGSEAQILKLKEAYKSVGDEVKTLDDYTKEAAEGIQDAIGEGLVDVLQGDFKSIGDNFGKLLAKMAAEALAADITKSLFGGVSGGTGGSLLEQLVSGAGTFFSGLFSGARATGGSVSENGAYLVGENGPEMFVPSTAGYVMNAGQTSDMQRGLASGSLAGVSNWNQTVNIQIDGTTDMARNQKMIRDAVRQGNIEFADKQQRAGVAR